MAKSFRKLTNSDLFQLSRALESAPFDPAAAERAQVINWIKATLNRPDITAAHASTFAAAADITFLRSVPESSARKARGVLAARMVVELAGALGHPVPDWWRAAANNAVSNEELARMLAGSENQSAG